MISLRTPYKQYRCTHPECSYGACIVKVYSAEEPQHPCFCVRIGCVVDFRECKDNGDLIE